MAIPFSTSKARNMLRSPTPTFLQMILASQTSPIPCILELGKFKYSIDFCYKEFMLIQFDIHNLVFNEL